MKILGRLILIMIIGVALCVAAHREYKASDAYIRKAVVRLAGETGGSCSAVQIDYSDKVVVLTAAHCRGLLVDGKVKAIREDGKTAELMFIAEDPKSDLMLLTGSSLFGSITVGEGVKVHEKVRTITHGGASPKAYKTEGEALGTQMVGFILSVISTPEGLEQCVQFPKNSVFVDFMMGDVYCVFQAVEMHATAPVIPGSSGGPLLNEAGELIGIVSCGAVDMPLFAYFVTIGDIRAFLSSTLKAS